MELTDGQREALAQLPGEKVEHNNYYDYDYEFHIHVGGVCSKGQCDRYYFFH